MLLESNILDFMHMKDGVDGADGIDGKSSYTVFLENEAYTFAGDTDSAIGETIQFGVIAYKGQNKISTSIGTIANIPSGMTASILNNNNTSSSIKIVVSNSFSSKSGSINIPITVDGITFIRNFSWSIAFKGIQGEGGTNGTSVEKVEVFYYSSTSNTSLSGGEWSSANIPQWVDGRYIWSKQKTTLTNGNSTETQPVCITGGKGQAGSTGRSVSNIVTEYYLSTSKVEPIGDTWSEERKEWVSGKYIWTRSKITYVNPSSAEYTTPMCDSTWESLQSQITNISLKVDQNTKTITQKASQSDITNAINDYDGSTVKTIRDTVATHTTQIGSITSEVSDVKTTLTSKADGSTATELTNRVAKAEQDASGFKQTVSKTYATKDSLKDYSTTTQMNTAISQSASSIKLEVDEKYGTKDSVAALEVRAGKIEASVSDNEKNISTLQQTASSLKTELSNTKGDISNLTLRADGLESTVTKKQDSKITAIRYIRDWLNGSSYDNNNHWVECQVIVRDTNPISTIETDTVTSQEKNIAKGKIPICKNENMQTITISNASTYTDGLTLELDEEDLSSKYVTNTGNCFLQLDLGQVRYDVEYLHIWHYFANDRIYNHKLQISTDGISWTTLYDSSVSGGYVEETGGKIHYINDNFMNDEFSSIKQNLSGIELDVKDAQNSFTSFKQDAEKIFTTVGNLETEKKETDESILNLTEQINNISNNYVGQSTFIQTIQNITGRVEATEEGLKKQSQEILDANGWKLLFAQLGMGDEKVETSVSMDITGMTLENKNNGRKVVVTTKEFSGYYNNEKVFYLDEYGCLTKRIYIENGWDTGRIKMVPTIYTDGSKEVNCVCYVKSGGNS